MGDVLLGASLQLPSPSVLTGNYRPQTAAAFVEQALLDAKARAAGSRLATPSTPSQSQKGSVEEVSALRSMASRHLGVLRQAPASPYHHHQHHHHQPTPAHQQSLPQRCVSTPPFRPVATSVFPPQSPAAPAPAPALQQQQPSSPVPPADTLAINGGGGAAAAAVAAGLTIREPSISAGGSGAGGGGPAAPHSRASGVLHTRPLAVTLSAPEPLPGGGSSGGGGAGSPALPSPRPVLAAPAGPASLPEPVLGSPNGSSAHPLLCAGHHLQAPAALGGNFVPHPQPGSLPRLVLSTEDTVPPASPTAPAAGLSAGTPFTTAAAASPHGGGGGGGSGFGSPRIRPASHHVLSPTPHPSLGQGTGAAPGLHHPPVRFASLAVPASSAVISRPSTSLPVQDLTLPRPGTRPAAGSSPIRASSVAAASGGGRGGGGGGVGGSQVWDCSRSVSAGGAKPGTPLAAQPRQGTPQSPLSPHWASRSTGGAAGSLDAGGHHHPGAFGGDEGGAGHAPAGAAPAAVAESTGNSLTASTGRGSGVGGAGGSSGSGMGAMRPGGGRFQHTATRWAANGVGSGGETGRPADGFKVTRGMLYSVFQELDEFDSGRLTYSAFEQAACKVGMRPAQAKRLFQQLDSQGRGFATMREWSSPQLQRQMEAFTRLYVLATRDRDGKPKDYSEIRSMHMAVQMAMVKLQLRRCGRAVSLDRLVQAFAYMDRDSNGALNSEEVEDALNSLGIFVTKDVIDTIMRTFDKDGSGGVDYYEFVKSLYPSLDHVVYHS